MTRMALTLHSDVKQWRHRKKQSSILMTIQWTLCSNFADTRTACWCDTVLSPLAVDSDEGGQG